jgi:hypothetical protein
VCLPIDGVATTPEWPGMKSKHRRLLSGLSFATVGCTRSVILERSENTAESLVLKYHKAELVSLKLCYLFL